MSVRLSNAPSLQRLTRRGTVLAGIVSLHVMAAIGFAAVRHGPPPVADLAPIDVVMLEETVQEHPPEPPPARLTDVRINELVMPYILFPADVAAPTAITVPVKAPVAAPVSGNVGYGNAVDDIEFDFVRPPAPRYPPTAKSARAQGVVLLFVVIDTDGHAREVRVHRTSGFEQLDAAARDAMRVALFKPVIENGVARTARVIVPITFSLTVRTARAG